MKREEYLKLRKMQGQETKIARMKDQKHRMMTRLTESETLETKRRIDHESYTENLRAKISGIDAEIDSLQNAYRHLKMYGHV